MKRMVIGLALASALIACSGESSPAAVVEEFGRKMENGNCSGVQDYLASSSRAMVGPKLEQACTAAAEMRKNDPKAKEKTIKSMRVVDSKVEGDRATVTMETEYSDGTKSGGDQPITLVKEEGRWRIDLLGSMTGEDGGASGSEMNPPAQPGPETSAPTPAPAEPAAPEDGDAGAAANEAETTE